MAQTSPTDPQGQRSPRLLDRLDQSLRDGTAVVLTGLGVGDLLITRGGAMVRAVQFLASWAASRERATVVYSLAGGARAVTAPGGPTAAVPNGTDAGTPPAVAIDQLLTGVARSDHPTTVIVDFTEGLLADGIGPFASTDTARVLELLAGPAVEPGFTALGHKLVLLARTSSVDSRLTGLPGIVTISVGLPEYGERRLAIDRLLVSPTRVLYLEPGLDAARAAAITGGLTLDDISRMRYRSDPAYPLTVRGIVREKTQVLRRLAGDTLITHDEPLDLDRDVAGLPQVRRLLEETLRTGARSIRAILSGPPGNGKTRVSTAIAARLGVPAVSLARIRAPYVGQAEDNLNRALAAIEAMAPCLLILDECDEAGLGRRTEHGGEGSEVTANLRARLFSWLGDNGEQLGISVIGLTNRPDRLDPAATDRFQQIPVLHPSAEELADIMAIQARRQSLPFDRDGAADALITANASMSGRQAVRVVDRALVHASAAGRHNITGDDVRTALAELISGLDGDSELHALLAIASTTWSAHLPWNADPRQSAGAPDYLRPFILTDGRLDTAALHRRIAELRASHGH